MNSRSLQSALLVFFISMLAIISCKKDIKNETQTPGNNFPIPAASPVTGSVTGKVVDENNAPVDGATVNLGASSITSDAQGMFSFNNVTLDKYVTTVTINKTGYFKAYRSFSANATRNYVSIKLIPKVLSGSVNSGSGGAVALSNGTNLSFQANSMLIKSSGAAYTGTVNVFAAYIDPTSSDISTKVPGSFMATDGTNMYSLQSTGMIAVELESASGEALQLASGLPATIKLPIPSSLQSKAPASINTWSLNEQGVWTKEGTATKSGNDYEMQVSHFSFWNCDVPANAVYLTLHVQDQNGNPLVNTLVELTVPNNNTWWATSYGFTDSLGNVSGLVPAGQSMEMTVYPDPYSCSNPVNTQTIGPFTTNTSLTVTTTLTAAQLLTVSGTATDCNSQPLQSGTAIIYAGPYSYQYVSIVNGSYTATITQCTPTTEINVTVIDNSNGNQNSSGPVAVSGNSVTVPSLSACGGTSQPAIFVFGNNQGSCQTVNFIGTYTAGVPLTNNAITMTVDVQAVGTYTITTTIANGITFSASGVFTQTGQQPVVLVGTGTPLTAGTYSYVTMANGMTGCNFVIPVQSTSGPQATFDLGSGSCSNIFVNGTYMAGVPMNIDNTVTITLNVTSPGSYYIFTNQTNGIMFSDSGTVTATGPVTLVLMGQGVSFGAGFNTYQLQSSTGAQGCVFGVTTQQSGNGAVYSFLGSPGNCTSASVNGSYIAGTQLDGQSTVTIAVEVTMPGTYSINTNFTNGMSFSAAGIFSSTGVQNVVLSASGTPTSSGTYTFIPQDNSIVGCVFIVPVN